MRLTIGSARLSIAPDRKGVPGRRSARLRAVALTVAGVLALFVASPTIPAHADSKVTWQNIGTGRYLEVYQSSTAIGAIVGTYAWNGTDTQYWWDTKLSNGYWWESNWNSGWRMRASSICSVGVTQSQATDYNTQWHELFLNSDDRWALINHAGCDSNPYTDVLAQKRNADYIYNVYLYPSGDQVYCTIGDPVIGADADCRWN